MLGHMGKIWQNDGAKLMAPEVLRPCYSTEANRQQTLCKIDFVTETIQLCKEKGVNTCLDTSEIKFTMNRS